MPSLLRRLTYLLRRSHRDAELREEMELHRALRQAALESGGMAADEAARASRRALGNVTLAREDAHRVWIAGWVEDAWHDARVGLRSFAQRPLLWITVVLSLALGIGVNTAVFSAFEALILRRLPVPAPEELVNVTSPGPKPGGRQTSNEGGVDSVFSYPLFRDIERLHDTSFAAIAAHAPFAAHLAGAGTDATIGSGRVVSGAYFQALGIRPALGRLLTPADDRVPGAHRVVVLGHQYWARTLGADPTVLNRTLMVNGEALVVVGVTPPDFVGNVLVGDPTDVFVPLAMTELMRQPGVIDARDNHWLYVFARLRPGVTRQQAETEINVPFTALIRDVEYPALRSGMGEPARTQFQARRIILEDGAYGQNGARAEMRTMLLLVFAITGAVLAIACANVANLLLARAADRQMETAVRLSMGATPGRLVRWLLAEACLLGLAGGVGAVGVAWMTVNAILAFAPAGNRPFEFTLNPSVALFALAVGLGTGVLFGLFPAIQGVRGAAAAGLHAQSTRTSSSRTANRVRSALAVAQVALATALLAVAGVGLANLVNIARAELGIRREGLATFSLSPGLAGYPRARTQALVAQLDEALRGLPGVTSVAAATVPILSNESHRQNLTVEGYEPAPGEDSTARRTSVSPGYFRTLGIPFLTGRDFTNADGGEHVNVAIVNEAFVRKFGLPAPAIGKRFGFGQGDDVTLDVEIVGIVGDAKYSNVRQAPPPQFFVPYRQSDNGGATVHVYVRAETDITALLAPIRAAVTSLAPDVPVRNLQTMEEHLWVEAVIHRLIATLSSSFAALATVLAAVGLYAVVAYAVARRWREFGIRLALGATPRDIRWSIVRHVGVIASAGTVIGTAVAVVLGRVGRSALEGLERYEPYVVLAAVATVLLVAAAAAALPARRAGAVRPVEVLKAE